MQITTFLPSIAITFGESLRLGEHCYDTLRHPLCSSEDIEHVIKTKNPETPKKLLGLPTSWKNLSLILRSPNEWDREIL